jgi:hypothetical protein
MSWSLDLYSKEAIPSKYFITTRCYEEKKKPAGNTIKKEIEIKCQLQVS